MRSAPLLATAFALSAPLAAQAPRPGLPEATVPPPIVLTTSADRTQAAVGEPVTLVYSARIPEGADLRLTHLVSPKRPEGQPATAGFALDFEPVGPAVAEQVKGGGGRVDVRQTVRVAAFVPGDTIVPGPVFSYRTPDGSTAVLRAPGVALTIASRLPEGEDPEKLAPKPARPVRIPARSPWFWAAIAAAVLAVAGLVTWLVRRRKKGPEAGTVVAPPPVPPDAELEAALAALAARATTLDGDPRPFFTDLTHAAKRFLERHLEEPVLEWTTFETVRRLRELGAEPPREVALAELLMGADRVKFGRAGATAAEAARALEGARHLLAWGRTRMAARAAAEREAAKTAKAQRPPAPAKAPGASRPAGGAR
ncbi:MAG TPA: hypothetical protein PLL76_13720 [Thermoanaerobaculia bacterium]|jgi:hypothetical protein|nr:hypothetical protein [Thermoanaerobaculia bacterium]HQN08446.1 hypothetical protein [Thermoanaerobaculia bacterium]HQP87306.1 hypothetical protein [Thermoanaerobaculia bacterium]